MSHYLKVSKGPSLASEMPIRSSMDLAVVVMVTSGVGRGGGKRGKVSWVAIGVGEGGVGV